MEEQRQHIQAQEAVARKKITQLRCVGCLHLDWSKLGHQDGAVKFLVGDEVLAKAWEEGFALSTGAPLPLPPPPPLPRSSSCGGDDTASAAALTFTAAVVEPAAPPPP